MQHVRSRRGLVAPIPSVYQTLALTSSHPPQFTLRRPPHRQPSLTTIRHCHSKVYSVDASCAPQVRHSGLPSCAAADRPVEKQPPRQLLPPIRLRTASSLHVKLLHRSVSVCELSASVQDCIVCAPSATSLTPATSTITSLVNKQTTLRQYSFDYTTHVGSQ